MGGRKVPGDISSDISEAPGGVFRVQPPVTEEELTIYLLKEQSWPRQTRSPLVPLSAKSGQFETAGSSKPIPEAHLMKRLKALGVTWKVSRPNPHRESKVWHQHISNSALQTFS